MNILIIHNRYSVKGGEESVVSMQQKLFSNAGHNVFTYFRDYNEIKSWKTKRLGSLFSSIINPVAMREVKEAIERDKIDVVFIHNLFPIISPFITRTIKKCGVKSIMFLHNYRLICPTGLFLSDGKPCEKCAKGIRELHCIKNRCEGSITGSIGYAIRNFSARFFNLYKNNVTIFCATTEFQREKLQKYGYHNCDIEIVNNFTTFHPQNDKTERDGTILYVGRLSFEKGFDLVFDLARKMGDKKFVMAGKYDPEFIKEYDVPKNVELLGEIDKETVEKLYRTSSLLIFPTRCYESFPLTLLEAGVNRLPIICSDIGASASIISDGENGLLFNPNDVDSTEEKANIILENVDLAEKLADEHFKICTTTFSSKNYISKIETLMKK